MNSDKRAFYTVMPSPLGDLLLTMNASTKALTGLYLEGESFAPDLEAYEENPRAFAGVKKQLDEYFAGERTTFDLDLDPEGTDFQRKVWKALARIPYGKTYSYGELAARLGRPSAARAVGAANGRNPIAIICACHRVVGSNGSLTGFRWGTDAKRWLLDHESRA